MLERIQEKYGEPELPLSDSALLPRLLGPLRFRNQGLSFNAHQRHIEFDMTLIIIDLKEAILGMPEPTINEDGFDLSGRAKDQLIRINAEEINQPTRPILACAGNIVRHKCARSVQVGVVNVPQRNEPTLSPR